MRTRSSISVGALLLAGVAAFTLSGCSSDTAATPASSSTALNGTITVFAAASLTGTFTQLAKDFEADNPGTTIKLNFAGSADLVTQITAGAPADVFASADEKNMAKVTSASLNEGDAVDFASNTLEIAVPTGNPAGIKTFADLADPDVKLVICAPEVPCGAATSMIETASKISLKPVSEESSVTDVLGKVSSGEADAGLVYVTDVKAAKGSVDGVPFDESSEAVNTYPLVSLKSSTTPKVAKAFVDFVSGSKGQAVLAAAGFGKP